MFVFLSILIFVAFVLLVLGLIYPPLALRRSRASALVTYGLALLVLLFASGLMMDDFESGVMSFESGDWDEAIKLLSKIDSTHAQYDSAQVLIAAAKEALAREEAEVGATGSVDSSARRIEWHARYVHSQVNVRKGPSTDYPVAFVLSPDDVFFAEDVRGAEWVAVARSDTASLPEGYVLARLVHPSPRAPEFERIRAAHRQFTDAQWQSYSQRLEGLMVVDWQGWVTDVRAAHRGQSEVWVDMDSPESLSVPEITLYLPEDMAIRLRKNQRVVFRGVISRVDEFMGTLRIFLEDATVR